MPTTDTKALEICGYTITERLSESARSLVYRGIQHSSGQKAVLKLPGDSSPSPEQLNRIKNEFIICSRFKHNKIISVLGLDQHDHLPVLLEEDFDGTPLSVHYQETADNILQFLDIAIQLTDALREIHRQKIIYKNLCPPHILFRSVTGRIKLIDFSIASTREKEYPFYSTNPSPQRSFAYISPEQTGRINKELDYRSDFYSLGVVLYEMLTGILPFTGTDLIEQIHSHLAKAPIPPHEHHPEIPLALSSIILKLLEKSANDRYQSCSGLIPDLMRCLIELQESRSIIDFAVGRDDISAVFSIPDKRYGRNNELEILLRSYDETGNGQTKTILLTGESGSGKSLLLQKATKALEGRGAIVLSGLVDSDPEHSPCGPIIKAFRALVQKILPAGNQERALWQQLFQRALGDQARIAVDIIPELELIIGVQPVAAESAPNHRRSQFVPLFSRLIKAIGKQFKTLVIIQDDLHRVDRDTLQLIEQFICDPDRAGLFIGGYRDNEPAASLDETLRRLTETGIDLVTLPLPALTIGDIGVLLSETLFQPLDVITPLARFCHDKTAGNPFFLKQFLTQLHESGAISFNAESGRWDCDLHAIAVMKVMPNVGELLTKRIGAYPPGARTVLQLAACIGNRFDLTLLSALYGKTRQQTRDELAKALNDGLVLFAPPLPRPEVVDGSDIGPAQEHCQFAHEHILHAAVSLLPFNELNTIHVRIGALMQQSFTPAAREFQMHEMVTHLNHGIFTLATDKQRLELAKLNLQAAQQARKSASFGHYRRFTATGLDLLPVSTWHTHYHFALELHSEAAEAAAQCHLLEETERLFALVCTRARNSIDKIRVYKTRMATCKAAYRLDEAVETGCEILAELGITFPNKLGKSTRYAALLATRLQLLGKTRQQLLELPEMSDRDQATIMDLLLELAIVAYQARPLLIPLVGFAAIRLSLKYGNHAASSIIGYPVYGFLLCALGSAGSISKGYEYGMLALELQKRRREGPHPFAIHLVNALIVHWKRHVGTTLTPLREASRLSLNRGETECAALCAASCSCRLFFLGQNLAIVEEEVGQYRHRLNDFPDPGSLFRHMLVQQAVANLLGHSANPALLNGAHYDGNRMPSLHHQGHDQTTLFIFHLLGQILAYLFGRYELAEEHGQQAFAVIDSAWSSFLVPILHFYHALTLLALCPESVPPGRRKRLRAAKSSIAKMRSWAVSAPENYLHKYHLMTAELNRISGRREKAAEQYDQAIRQAGHYGFLQEEALGHERAAAFYHSINRSLVARSYFTEALRCYKRWGAVAVINHLLKHYGELSIDPLTPRKGAMALFPAPALSADGNHLDIMSFIKVSRTFSGEVVLDEVVKKLIMILLENAGAENGFLIMNIPDSPMVKVKAESSKHQGIIVDTPLLALGQELSLAIVNYVARFGKTVVLDNASENGLFITDRYVLQNQPKSILCMPIKHQGEILAVVYLENNLTASAFSSEHIDILDLIASQAAISIKNAQLYGELQRTLANLHREVAKRKETQLQLLHAGKLSALGRLSASIAHEFGNPLMGIKYLLDDLSQRHELNPEDRHLIAIGLQECERMKHLINDLHDLHRPSTGAKKMVNLNDTVENVLHLQRKSLKDAKITVRTQLSHDLPDILAAEDQITQVLVNLSSNALDAMKEKGGTLLVETYGQVDRVFLKITDNGCGIADEHREHIFEPFFSTKRYTDGVGLGLAIAYNIVKNHRGDITFVSTPGNGSAFTVSFALNDDSGSPPRSDRHLPVQ